MGDSETFFTIADPLFHKSFFLFLTQVNFLFWNSLTNPNLEHAAPLFGFVALIAGVESTEANKKLRVSIALALVIFIHESYSQS
jgi:hypothetical protein